MSSAGNAPFTWFHEERCSVDAQQRRFRIDRARALRSAPKPFPASFATRPCAVIILWQQESRRDASTRSRSSRTLLVCGQVYAYVSAIVAAQQGRRRKAQEAGSGESTAGDPIHIHTARVTPTMATGVLQKLWTLSLPLPPTPIGQAIDRSSQARSRHKWTPATSERR